MTDMTAEEKARWFEQNAWKWTKKGGDAQLRQLEIAKQVYQEYLVAVQIKVAPRLTWLTQEQVYKAVADIFDARNPVGTIAEIASAHSLEELQQMAREAGVTVEPQDTKRVIAKKLGAKGV